MKKLANILLVALLVGLIAYIGVGHVQKRIEAEKLATANSVRAQMIATIVTATPEAIAITPGPVETPIPITVSVETPIPISGPRTLQEAIDRTIIEDEKGIYHIVFKNTEEVEILDYPISTDEFDTFFFVMNGQKIIGIYYGEEATKVYSSGKLATMKQIAKCFCKDGEVQKKYLTIGFLDGEVTEFETINFKVEVGRIRELDGSYTYGLILCGGHSKNTGGGNKPASTATPTNAPVPTGVPTVAPTNTPGPTGGPTNTPAPTHGPTNTPAPTHGPTATPVGPTHEPTQVPPTHGPTEAPTHEPTSVPTTAPDPSLPPKHEATPAPQKTTEPSHGETLPPKNSGSSTHETVTASTVSAEEISEAEEQLPTK